MIIGIVFPFRHLGGVGFSRYPKVVVNRGNYCNTTLISIFPGYFVRVEDVPLG